MIPLMAKVLLPGPQSTGYQYWQYESWIDSNAWQKEQDAIKLEIQVLKRNEEIGKAAHSEVIQLNTLQVIATF